MFVANSTAPGVTEPAQIAIVLVFVGAVYGMLAWLLLRERTGRTTLVGRLADHVSGLDGSPRWAAVSPILQTASILSAGFGVWWDISFHLDHGRDAGPFGTPAHYPIFFGLLGIMASGVITCALARSPMPAGSLRVTRGWQLPLSGVFVVVAGTFSLASFPLDDLWHRIFGEDVTLWGPTHLLMIGGAVIALFALFMLRAEATQVSGPRRRYALLDMVSGGALLIAFELFATEYDFGVPQFPLLAHPLLLVLGTVVPFVLVRARRGRGAAIGALVVYLAIRGTITFLVGGPLDRVTPHLPLYVVEALLVEGVALLIGTRRRFVFGAVAGVAIGTVGVLSEFWWSHIWMPIAWPSSILPTAMALGVVTGVGGGAVAAWVATRLDEISSSPEVAEPTRYAGSSPAATSRAATSVRRSHLLALAGLVAVVVPFVLTVPRTAHTDVSAQVTVQPVGSSGSSGSAEAVVMLRLTPADAADKALWFNSTTWQGGTTTVAPMVRVAEGVYRTPTAVPLTGRSKSTIRLHRGPNDMLSLPVHMPADAEISKPGILMVSGQTAAFVDDQQVMRREESSDLPGWYWTAGNGALGVVSLIELGILSWLLARGGAAARTRQVCAAVAPKAVKSLTI